MTRVALTYREYAALPDDGRRYEIHDGELSVTPSPGTLHDVILSERTVVQPDLVFMARDREHLVSDHGVEGAPTLAVEILSPSTVQIDRVRERQLYACHGVPFYWLVDPEERVIEAVSRDLAGRQGRRTRSPSRSAASA
jgi:Uma2 family endonuclease